MSVKSKVDKKRVGILTFHDGFNCGAFLQAFALQEVMKSMGLSPQIVDYRSRRHSMLEYRFLFVTKRVKTLLGNIRKVVKFKLAHRLYSLSKSAGSAAGLSSLSYDYLVCGSDEIWNYSNSIVGIDPVYFGVGIKATKKIAYAPSCGSLPEASEIPDQLQQAWRSFACLSVRDDNSKKIVERCTSQAAEIVLDPTFLMNFDGYEKTPAHKDYILIYTTGFEPALQEKARNYAKKKGKKLISIGYVDHFSDINVIGIGPFEFLGFFKEASEVITNTLHGVIFSVKYNKQLAIIQDSYRQNKLATIIDVFGLRGRVLPTNGEGLEKCLETPIDFEVINRVISDRVVTSREYLSRSLECN